MALVAAWGASASPWSLGYIRPVVSVSSVAQPVTTPTWYSTVSRVRCLSGMAGSLLGVTGLSPRCQPGCISVRSDPCLPAAP